MLRGCFFHYFQQSIAPFYIYRPSFIFLPNNISDRRLNLILSIPYIRFAKSVNGSSFKSSSCYLKLSHFIFLCLFARTMNSCLLITSSLCFAEITAKIARILLSPPGIYPESVDIWVCVYVCVWACVVRGCVYYIYIFSQYIFYMSLSLLMSLPLTSIHPEPETQNPVPEEGFETRICRESTTFKENAKVWLSCRLFRPRLMVKQRRSTSP